MKKINLFAIICLLTVISCQSHDSDDKEKKIEEQQKQISELEQKLKEKTKIDTTSTTIPYTQNPEQAKNDKPFISGRFKTLPEMIKSVFIQGSSNAEIKTILGEPEFIDKKNLHREIWYYGQLEIEFQDEIATKIRNAEKCKQYLGNEIEFSDLLISPDRIERKFANRIIERKTGLTLKDD
jgi:cell division septum initiation protein DivIVA